MNVVARAREGLAVSRPELLRGARGRVDRGDLATALLVAVATVALAYPDGGTDPQIRAGATVLLWCTVAAGLALGVWPRAPIPRSALLAGACLLGLALLTAVSLMWADNGEHAFQAVGRVLMYLGLFTVVVLASSSGRARPWLVGLALGLTAVAVMALVSRCLPGLFSEAQAVKASHPAARLRLSFPTGYWNGLGTCMAMGILLLAWLGAEGRARVARAAAVASIPVAAMVLFLTSSRGGVLALLAGLLVLLLVSRNRLVLAASTSVGIVAAILIIALGMTLAPDVVDGHLTPAEHGEGNLMLGLAVVVVAIAGALRYAIDPLLPRLRLPRVKVPEARQAIPALLILVAAVVAVVSLTGPGRAAATSLGDRIRNVCEPPSERLSVYSPEQGFPTVTRHLASSTGTGRCQYWEVGFDAFLSAPVAGIGAGGFEGWWSEHHAFPTPASFSHSIFITHLAELGPVGLALIVGFLSLAWVGAIRTPRGPPGVRAAALAVLAAGTLAAAIDWMWEVPSAFAPVVLAAALITGPALAEGRAGRFARFPLTAVMLSVAAVATGAALLSFLGQGKIEQSDDALEDGNLQKAIDDADAATTFQPWASEPYLLKAAALEGQGDLSAAEDAIDEAVERAPSDFRAWAVAARIEAKRGDPFGALESLARANALNPTVRPFEAAPDSP